MSQSKMFIFTLQDLVSQYINQRPTLWLNTRLKRASIRFVAVKMKHDTSDSLKFFHTLCISLAMNKVYNPSRSTEVAVLLHYFFIYFVSKSKKRRPRENARQGIPPDCH